jgi:hypothetical protein
MSKEQAMQGQPQAAQPPVVLPQIGGRPAPQLDEGQKNAMIEQHMRLTDALENLPSDSPERANAMQQWLDLDGQLRQMIPQMPEAQPPAYNPASFDPSRPASMI